MKKVLFCAAMVAAMIFTACGKSEKKEVSAELQAAIEMLNAKAAEEGQDISIALKGDDVVLSSTVDESDLPAGMTLENLIAMYNASGDAMAKMMVANIFAEMDEADREIISVLRENKCNLVFHFIGAQSGQEGDFTVRYDLLPE